MCDKTAAPDALPGAHSDKGRRKTQGDACVAHTKARFVAMTRAFAKNLRAMEAVSPSMS
jgi:hypothetical protein